MSTDEQRIIKAIRTVLRDLEVDLGPAGMQARVGDFFPAAGQRRLIQMVVERLDDTDLGRPSRRMISNAARRRSLTFVQLTNLLAAAYRAGAEEEDGGVGMAGLPPSYGYIERVELDFHRLELIVESDGSDVAEGRDDLPAPPSLRPAPRAPTSSNKAAPASEEVGFRLVKVFYATDRKKLATKPGHVLDFGSGWEDALQLGECEVSIPAKHRKGQVERPQWWKFEFAEDPERHVTLRTVTELGDEDFYGRISRTVAKSRQREAFVFVHGYNVKFANALRQTAQMAFDLKFEGAPILYSWPSQGALAGYVVDSNTVIRTETHLTDFLTEVATRTGALRVHVIAHSMGNRAVCNALETLSQRARPLTNLHHVVLTAPDVDAGVFRNVVRVFKALPKSITLYASSRDKAIMASKKVNGAPRAGEPIIILPGIDSIDASAVETDFLAHGYFSGTRSVLSDIARLLRDEPANTRFDLTSARHQDGPYYQFVP